MTKCSMVSLPNGKKVRAILENKSLLFRGVEVAQAFGYNDPDLVIRRECSEFELKRIEVDGVPTDSLFISENDVYRLARANKCIAGIEMLDWVENYVCPTVQVMEYECRSLLNRLHKQGFIQEGKTYWINEKEEEELECK